LKIIVLNKLGRKGLSVSCKSSVWWC